MEEPPPKETKYSKTILMVNQMGLHLLAGRRRRGTDCIMTPIQAGTGMAAHVSRHLVIAAKQGEVGRSVVRPTERDPF